METKFNRCPSVFVPHLSELAGDLDAGRCSVTEAVAALREVAEPIGYSVAVTPNLIGLANTDGLEIFTLTLTLTP